MATTQVKTDLIEDGAVTSAKLDTNIAIDGNLTVDTNTLFVDSSNNRVGIGTTSPTTKLHVNGPAGNQIRYTSPNVTNILGVTGLDEGIIGTITNHSLVLYTNGTERMRIDPSGVLQVRNQTPTIQLYNTDNGLELNQTLGDIDWYQIDPSDQGVGTVAKIRAVNVGSIAGYGELAFHTGSATSINERVRINYQGNVGIGTTSPSAKLDVVGTIECTSLTETSALRFKENIQENVDTSIIDKLRPVSYDWKETGDKDYGFIAEEVDELDSILTTKEEDGQLIGIKYTKLIPFLVKKIQEQEERIKQLENGKS